MKHRGSPIARIAAVGALATAAIGLALALASHPANSFGPFDPALQPRRIELLDKAGAELRRGDATSALDDYERAAMMYHSADAETGLILAALQSGQYRRALAFCAHTAGAHLEDTDAGALYAWLLRIGGQDAYARQVLDRTLVRFPDAPFPHAVAQAFVAPLPIAVGRLLEPKDRLAPWPTMVGGQAPTPADVQLAGGAVLVAGGRQALMPIAGLVSLASLGDTGAGRLWVRNGLGQTTEAVVDSTNPAWAAVGLVMLRLAAPLPDSDATLSSTPAPFAGSPGYAVQYADTAAPAWPWLRQGFLGGAQAGRQGGGGGGGSVDLRRLGFDIGNGPAGAPVLDAKGRLVGITVRAASRNTSWLPTSAWPAAAAELPARAPSAAFAGRAASSAPANPPGVQNLVAPDAIYEAGLRLALQVVAAPK